MRLGLTLGSNYVRLNPAVLIIMQSEGESVSNRLGFHVFKYMHLKEGPVFLKFIHDPIGCHFLEEFVSRKTIT